MIKGNRIVVVMPAGLVLILSVTFVYAQESTKDDFIVQTLEKIDEVLIDEAVKQMNDVIFLDVRTKAEVLAGRIPGSIHLQRGFLERKIHNLIPDKNTKIIIYCKAGNRSALAASTLMKMGYKSVYNLSEGYDAWKNAGYPVSR